MGIEILSNCDFDLDKIKTLFIGSRLTDGNPIVYPIEYTTISGSDDSIIRITGFNYLNNVVTIGGQDIQMVEITNLGDNLSFDEVLSIGSNGKIYTKTISFIIPNINIFLITQLKEFTISSDGKFALSPTIAILIDENDNQLIVGYDKPLYLQSQNLAIGEGNEVQLTYSSSSMSRSRNVIYSTTIWDSLLSYYNFNTGSGTIAYDSVSTNNGTFSGDTQWNVNGKNDDCVKFNTSGSTINFGNVFNFDRFNSFSVSLWYKPISTTGLYRKIYNKQLDGTGNYKGYSLQLNNALLNWEMFTLYPSSAISIEAPTLIDNVNLWYHIVSTYNGSNDANGVNIYVNGVKQNITILNNNLNESILSTAEFRINTEYTAYTDEFGIWGRELTENEVIQIYNDGIGLFYT